MTLRISRSFAIEFGPLLLFFISFELRGFLFATAVLVAATALALTAAYMAERRIALFPLISGLCVLFFGSLTLFTEDARFLALEYTLYNGVFGFALLIGILFDRPLLRSMFGTIFALTDRGWLLLSFRWGVFFLLVAFSNELIWRYASEHVWVIFRFAVLPAALVFGLYQFRLSRRERLPEASAWGMIR